MAARGASKKRRPLADELAELTSVAPSQSFDPEAVDYDGTAAGASLFGDENHEEEDGEHPSEARRVGGPGSLRVSADMDLIGQEYGGLRVTRKEMSRDVEMNGGASEDGGQEEDEDGEGDGEGWGEAGEGSVGALKGLSLDDVSSSDSSDGGEVSGEDNDGDDDDDDDNDNDDSRAQQAHKGKGRTGSSTAAAAAQANVFSGGVGGVDASDVNAYVEDQMALLWRQDESAGRKRARAGEAEVRRAKEALRQRQWWDGLLEVRILLQRLLNNVNRLPGAEEIPLFFSLDAQGKHGGESESGQGESGLAAAAEAGATALTDLATDLIRVRQLQMQRWGIASGDAGERDGTGSGGGGGGGGTGGKRPAWEVGEGEGDPWEQSSADYKACARWSEKVTDDWQKRTQMLGAGGSLSGKRGKRQAFQGEEKDKFRVRVLNQGPWAQARGSMADPLRGERKLYMRQAETQTFLGRSLATRRRSAEEEKEGGGEEGRRLEVEGLELPADELKKERDPLDRDVLDDRELYQHLLKEFVEASGGADGVAPGVGVARAHRRSGSSSIKKDMDRRASKGRKLKFVVHPKLQNFMFPQNYPAPPMEPSKLFSSLFGGGAMH